MPMCPFCETKIDAVIAKFEERRITKYLIHYVTEDGMEVERWDKIDSRVTEDSLMKVSCPRCHKPLPLFSEIDIELFLNEQILLVHKNAVRMLPNDEVEYNGKIYSIADEFDDILTLVGGWEDLKKDSLEFLNCGSEYAKTSL